MIFGLFRKDPREDVVLALYTRVADASRAPWLYRDAGVPDTVEGRLDALTVHVMLVLRHLKTLPDPAPDVAQDLVDTLFLHIDHGLRELGVGDVVVPKRMKKIAQNFYGRVGVYTAPLAAADTDELAGALARNIPGADSARLAAWLIAAERRLAGFALDDVLQRDDLFHGSPFADAPVPVAGEVKP